MICMDAPVLHLAGGFDLRPAVESDAGTIAGWMRLPHVARWWQQPWPAERWSEEVGRLAGGDCSVPCMLSLDGTELGYVELYRVRRDPLGDYYDCDLYDWGVHVAIGEPDRIGGGIGRRLLAALAGALFAADPRCRRVVAEPDVRNEPSIRAFAAAGFVRVADLRLPDKTAALMVYQRRADD